MKEEKMEETEIKTLEDLGFGIAVLDSRPDRIYIGQRTGYDKETNEWILAKAYVVTKYTVDGVIGLASNGPGKNASRIHGNGDVKVRIPCIQLSHFITLSEEWRNFYANKL